MPFSSKIGCLYCACGLLKVTRKIPGTLTHHPSGIRAKTH
jgi:hypothetical protein